MRPRVVVSLALGCALTIPACGGDEAEPPPVASPTVTESTGGTPSATPTELAPSPTSSALGETPACPDQDAIVGDETLRSPGRLVGEIDGDDIPDEISLAIDETGDPGCRAFLVAESAGDLRSAAIPATDIPFEMGFPRLISIVEIDNRAGGEIVVGVTAGASTQFAAVFTAVSGSIVPVTRSGATFEQSLLPYGGSVGHQDAFDCAPEAGAGAIVVSTAEPVGAGARFRYLRAYFFPEAPAVYVEDRTLRDQGTLSVERLETLHEFPNAPFGSCPSGETPG